METHSTFSAVKSLHLVVVKSAFTALCILFSFSAFAQLSGTYTIGGTSPNYATFTAAVSALSSSGVSGPVTFNVRQGSYNEKLTIGAITGASATNKITFRADPANSAAVLLQYTNSSTSANYVVGFNSATYIYFKNIDFKANGTSYSTVVELSGLNHHIGFDSCKIESNNTVTGSSTYRCAIYELSGSSHRTSYFNLSNSQIIGGSYGVYVQGYSSGIFSQSNWNIEGNTIEDFYYAGIMLSNYIDTSVVKGNSVIQRSNSVSTSYGIYVYQCYQTNVLDNKVVMYAYGAYGLQASYCYGTSTNPVFIANNMVSVDNTLSSGTRYAFTSSYNTYANIVYNSIFQNGIGYALYAIYGSGCTYKNNAIVNLDNTSSSYGYYSLGTSVESNNLVWAPNCIVTNLTLSTSSVIANPSFQAKDNLHASGIHLNNSGTPITGITTDFDGQTRNTTTPDIGADEFTPPANDAGIAEIANSTICAGSTPIQVRLQNFGSNNLTSVTVNWSVKVNTGSYVGQTAYSFTGSVASGKDTVVTISNYSFTGSNTYDIKAWTTSPNSSTDGNNLNDTSSKTMTPSLGGIYTIGGTSPDYTTIQSALTDLKNKGVCAPVVFRIRAGSYIESVMVDSARGMSAINTVTLTKDPASTGVVLWGYNGIPLSFRYAHHFIIKNLNLVTLSASPVVYFYQENSHIKLISNNIKGYYTSTSSQSYAAIYNPNSSAYTNSYITIDSNRIVGGSSSIHMAGYSNYAPYRELGLRIRNNEIDSAGYYGIYLINQDSSEIIGNSLKEGNLYGTYYGLYTSNVSNFKIESNRFILANYSGTYGFYINSGGGSSGLHSSIINNYIQTNSGQYGAFLSQVGYFDFYYNTIKMSGTVNNSYALYLSYGYAFLKNNNISHLGEGYALYGINGSYLLLSDYNNIYSASTSKFSYYNGSYQSNFSAYKTASSKDANSVSVNPFFRLPNEPTPNHGSLNNAGDPISGITKDINGVTRHATTPDMGCVEFIPSTNDAGLTAIDSSSVCPGTTPVKVRLTNFGNNTLTQARIQWNVKTNSGSPIAQTAFTWTGSLPSYSDTLISIGNYTFVGSNSYSITAYTDQANSTTDPVHGNDTARIFSLTPKMTGTYTVGGTSPDYSTLSSAFMALNSNGVCGPVILNVRGGTYYGSMSVPSVPGSSTTNTITVQTDPSSSNRATFTNSYYPFSFFGASHYIFKKLTITVTGNSNVIYFNGSNEYITFDNDSLIGSTVNSTGTSYSVFYDLTGSSQIQKNLTIKNCQIIGGSYGIYLYGNGSSGTYAQSNIRIENNQILDYYYTGIRSFYSPEMLISNNKMKDRGNSTGGYGIELTYSDSSEISNNDIEMSYSTGIYAGYCYGNANTRGVSIFNNMIKFTDTVTTSNNYNGIYLTVCYYSLVAYNSVNMPKSNTSSYGLYTQSGSNNDILNNNFINKGNGYSIYIGTASGVSALNYNNLYSNGLNLGYYNGNRANLAAWKTATGKSANSINVDPQYVSYLNLHAQNSAIDGAGTPIAGITTDIDGQARSATAPDIGADEFTIYANDAGISSLNNLSVCVGSTPIQVTLRNYGTNTLTSTSIQWAVSTNGGGFVAQTSYSFAGSLGAGKDTVLTIGNFNFGSTGRYAVRVNTSGFNSGTDQNLLNDTTAVGGLSPKLSGTYTVGSSISDDWSTIDSAITALETIGVCGPTTILVRSGSYNEGVSFTRIPGASSTNTVTILGDHLGTGVDWYNGSTPLTIYDLSHVTFKNLNIRTTGYTIAIRLSEDNSYVTFDSNRIEGVNYNHTSQNYSVIYNDNSSLRQQHHITFIRNTIKYGTYSIYWLGYGTGSNLESNNRFIDNDIKEAYLHGIYTQNQDSLVISGNKIRLKANAGTGYGIYLNYDYHFKVHRNNIYMPNSGYGLYAVYAYGTAADSSEIFNNFITIGGNLGIRGIFLNYGNRIKVYHNSVRLSNSNSSSVAFYSTNSSAMLSYNNIFSNEGGGYAVYYNQVASVFSNYNNYYTSGSNLGIYSVNRATLSDWQTATGLDANSLSTLTSFTDTFDLHTSSSLLNNAGTPVGVLTDYDGDTRSLTNPDIGADEFNSLPRDLALLKITKSACEGSNPISVRIQNAGTTNITSGKIKWALGTNGGSMVAQTPFNLPSLATLKDTVVTLGSVTFAKGSYYRILIYVDSINGALDQNHLNDTLKIDTAYSAMNGNYTVGGTTPDFSSISNAVFALKQRGVCGPTTFSIRSGSYVDRIVLSDSIKGSSITNMITFRTDPASTSQAEIRSSQPVVSLLNGRYLNFENLHINHIGFNQSVWLQGISKHLRFEDNTITGANITSTATNYNTIAMTGGSTERSYDISFINNVISGGSNAMYFLTSNWGGMSNFTIEGNEIKNFCQYGIFFQYADSLNIKNNYIHASRVGSYSPQGISLNNLFGYSVSGNQIHLGNASTLNIYGIRLYYADGFAGDSAKVFNNMISIQCAGSNYKTGLDLYYSEYVDVAFNSINHYGYGSNNAPIYISGGNYQRLRNNIFSNQAGNWALYTNRNLEVSDYNNFYSNGANLTYYNGNRSTLAAWRTYTGDDLNSISTTPGFVNDSNLHSSSSIINGAATPLSWVTTDFDGQNRSTTAPDIGADEFNPAPRDGALSPVSEIFCLGSNVLKVRLENIGTQNITSAKIKWYVSTNGGGFVPQSPASFTGSLVLGNSAIVSLGSFNFGPGNIYAYRAVIDSINNNTDLNAANDTSNLGGISPALNGIYTIGASGDFKSFGAADSALDNYGVCGSVIFDVEQGSYNESVTMGNYKGVNAANTITFRADTSNTGAVNWSTHAIPLQLDSASHITFEGLNFTTSGASSTVLISGNCSALTFKNNVFTGANTSNSNPIYATVRYVYSLNSRFDHFTFEGNTFNQGSYGYYTQGNSSTSFSKVSFKNNRFNNYRYEGIYLQYVDSVTIEDNEFKNGQLGGTYGVEMNYINQFSVQRNKIDNSALSGTAAMLIGWSTGTASNRSVVANNFFVGRANNFISMVDLRSNAYVDFYYNSINVLGTGTSSIGLYTINGNNNIYRNNNIVNAAGGYAVYTNGASEYTNSNYNNLYSTSSSVLGYFRGGNYSTLSAWRSASSQDANSVSGDPFYKSATDLHALGTASNNSGTSLAGFTTDIDGDLRGTTPDIGADEYTASPNDAGIDSISQALLCTGSNAILVQLTNYGTDTLKSARINWALAKDYSVAQAQTPFNWVGTLATGKSAMVNVGTYNFSPDTSYQILVNSSLPNGATDGFLGNDSSQNVSRKTAMSGTYVVALSGTRDYSSLVALATDLNTRGVCGPVRVKIKSGTYNGNTTLAQIEGANASNTITIEADSANTSPAILNSNSYTLQLNGTDYITVKGLEIRSNYYAPVYLSSGNINVTIENNTIVNTMNYYAGSTYYISGITAYNVGNSPNSNVTIKNNIINGGVYGIYAQSVVSGSNLNIEDNHISNFKSIGLYLHNEGVVSITNNEVFDSTLAYGNYGMYISQCNADIIGNKVAIHNTSTTRGIEIQNNIGSTSAHHVVANNAVSLSKSGNNGASYLGIYVSSSDYIDFYYNSVDIVGTIGGTTVGLYINSGSNMTLMNNSFVNRSGGVAMHISGSSALSASNYNNLFTNGNWLVYRTTNYATLTAWRNASGFDGNSTNADANYMSAYEMRPNHIALDGTANSITGYTTDITGAARGTSPDIGAYQFTTRADDAGIVTLKSKKLCTGTQSVVLALKNFGGDTLKSAQVNWAISRNGGAFVPQTAYNWNGIMPPGDVDSNVVVGSFSFIGGDYKLLAYTRQPNATTDELFTNDTLKDEFFIQLSGTYTLGDTGSDFKTWNEFANTINNGGICGSVVIKAKPKTYPESFRLTNVTGLSASRTLTLTADTGSGQVLITDTLAPIGLYDMKYVTIKNLHLKSTGADAALRIEGSAARIAIDSNTIEGPLAYSNAGNESGIYVNRTGSAQLYDVWIRDNKIMNGSSGIYMTSNSTSAALGDFRIERNEITNFYDNGIYLYGADTLLIEKNKVASSAGMASTAISLNYVKRFDVLNNKIEITSSQAGKGMYFNRADGYSFKHASIVNNFVQVAGGSGFDINNSSYHDVWHNSVHINRNKKSLTAGTAVYTFSVSQMSFLNNSFANTAGGTVYNRYNGFSSNRNNLYTSGQLLANNNIQTLAAWRSASGEDASSVSADPIYLSETDLHANQTLMDSAGLILSAFPRDIDGDLRNPSRPDIGADEFDLIFNVGIVDVLQPESYRARKWTSTQFTTSEDIEIVVRNFGPDVNDIPVEFLFNGIQHRDTIRGLLGAGKLDTFKFVLAVNMDTVGTYPLTIFTAMPNDQYIQNDTVNIDIVTLENAIIKLPFIEDFENVKDTSIFENYLGLWDLPEWDFVTDGGRLQTKSGYKSSGEQAITLDRTPNGAVQFNELIMTLNMSRYDMTDSVYLSFDFIDHRDENHKGDSVWVRGSDTSPWIGIYDLYKNRRTNRVAEVEDLEITSALAGAGQLFTTSFQVRFGQEDNQQLPGDGRTFDNIELRVVHSLDLAIAEAQVEYMQVPKEMANNRFTGRVKNMGYQTINNPRFTTSVLTATASSTWSSLLRDQDSLVSVTDSMHINTVGVYRANMSVSFTGTDKCPENDVAEINFSLSDTVLARDNNVVDSTFGFAAIKGEMGSILEVFKTDTITSISFYLNFPTLGDTIRAHVYDYSGSIGSRRVSAVEYVVTSNASRWYTLPIKCMEVLTPGKYLVAVEQSSTNYLTLGVTQSNYQHGASYIKTGSTWHAFEDSLAGYLFNIHGNFGHYDAPILTAPSAICGSSAPVILRSNKAGGKFFGPGMVNDSLFNPTVAGFGTHNIKYGVVSSNGCKDSNGVRIIVDSIPVVGLSNIAAICENGGTVSLTGGTPAGGSYFGGGVSGGQFNPSVVGAGNHSIFYRYAKPTSGCSDTANTTVRVKAKPNVALNNLPDFCMNENSVPLTQGTPSGGTYFGTGVTGNQFDPKTAGLGNHNITYSFTDTNACSNTASQLIAVNDTPTVNLGADRVACPKQTVTLDAGNAGSQYVWSNGLLTKTIVASTTGSYSVTVTDGNGCKNDDTVVVTIDAVCTGIGEQNSLENSVTYFPNPNSGLFQIRLVGHDGKKVELTVRNMQGQLVKQYTWETEGSELLEEIDLSTEATGVYFLDLKTDAGRAVHRVTVR